MPLQQVMEMINLLDSAKVTGQQIGDAFLARGWDRWQVETITGPQGKTDFMTVTLPGAQGLQGGGSAPTLGIVGRLGGIGARPEISGMVSDADGAIVAMAVALRLIEMRGQGDPLEGDVIITTHISPVAPSASEEHRGPVRMMGSPVERDELLKREVHPEMVAILSIDATKGNRLLNQRGFAITPTVKEGYLLPPTDNMLDIMQNVTGRMPQVIPLATQDFAGSGELRHINSIMMPSTMTKSPVMGVATTAAVAVPGVATGANQPTDLDEAARFCIEVAKAFGRGECSFYNAQEFVRIVELYGSLSHLQTPGRQ